MRSYQTAAAFACLIVSSAMLAGTVFLAPSLVQAENKLPDAATNCTCPENNRQDLKSLWPRPKFAEIRPSFDASDEVATLEALQLALSEVGDGSSYVWHRRNGRLSGVVQPTVSFKDVSGKICRHIMVVLSTGAYSRKTEGVACRLASGIWQLDG